VLIVFDHFTLLLKKEPIALMGIPPQSYGMPLAVRDHIVLPATQRNWTHPA